MSTADLTHDRTALPAEIESPGSKLVYLYLRTVEGATIDELRSSLGMQQLALFPILDTLSTQELIARDGERYTVAT